MERAEGEVNEGQAVEGQEAKISEEESTEQSEDFNPFLVEPILRKLLKKVDTVAEVKELRKICVLWDKVGLEDLEDRAFDGKLKAIDFQWNDRFKNKADAEKELIEFLEDTRAIPQLFKAFKFNIPESLKVLQDHPTFFSDYPISRVELVTPGMTDKVKVAMKYFLSLIGHNIKEIQINSPYNYDKSFNQFKPITPSWIEPELNLSRLEKLDLKSIQKTDWSDFFNSAIGKGSGHLTSLALDSLPGADIGSFPGLDPPRMTRLCISLGSQVKTSGIALKIFTGLMILAEKGMMLVDFCLNINFQFQNDSPSILAQNLPRITSIMTNFLTTQSTTLTTLCMNLNFLIYYHSILPWSDPQLEIDAEFDFAGYGRIQFPVFHALHTLDLNNPLQIMIGDEIHGYNTGLEISIIESSSLNFPSLVNATFYSLLSMNILGYNPKQMEQPSKYHFKNLSLIVPHYYDLGVWNLQIEDLIESVEKLTVPAKLLEQMEIPWTESLCELTLILEFGKAILTPFKLAHLKNLKILIIVDYGRSIVYEKIVRDRRFGEDFESWSYIVEFYQAMTQIISEYLSCFSEATNLNLIKFIGLKINEEDEEGIKEEFVRYFPFPVQFEKDWKRV